MATAKRWGAVSRSSRSALVQGLFCSELCRQTADTIGYWRRTIRDGRIERPDIKRALRTRIAHLLAGGYSERARRVPEDVRRQVRIRDHGLCRACGRPGEEIDHINGDSSALANLQLLCRDCHYTKTESRMAPASAEQRQAVEKLIRERVQPDQPALRCDDEVQWAGEWRQLGRGDRGKRSVATPEPRPRSYPIRPAGMSSLTER
jgi:5-methylcytosine-specific restriction endonuclease McrA